MPIWFRMRQLTEVACHRNTAAMPSKLPAPHLKLHNFLPADAHAALFQWTLANEARFVASGVGAEGKVDNAVRRSQTLLDLGPSHAVFEAAVRDGYNDWVRGLRASNFEVAQVELQLAAHNDGAHFQRHVDTQVHAPTGTTVRALSAVYYFFREPKAFTGGALRLYPFGSGLNEQACEAVEPEQNTLVVFPAWAMHEVATVHCPSGQFADSRFAVNCWLHMQR